MAVDTKRSTNKAPLSLSTSYLIGSAWAGISMMTLKSLGSFLPDETRSRAMGFFRVILDPASEEHYPRPRFDWQKKPFAHEPDASPHSHAGHSRRAAPLDHLAASGVVLRKGTRRLGTGPACLHRV